MAILAPLSELDEVAYLRFASVYRNFSSVADFEKEIADLRASCAGPGGGERDGTGRGAGRAGDGTTVSDPGATPGTG